MLPRAVMLTSLFPLCMLPCGHGDVRALGWICSSVSAGHGWAYGYDAIGSHEKVSAVCSGTGQTLIQPVLDNQIEFKQQWGAPKVDLSLEATVELIRDAFTSAGERDIYTGDYVEICKITKDGVEVEEFQLKLD